MEQSAEGVRRFVAHQGHRNGRQLDVGHLHPRCYLGELHHSRQQRTQQPRLWGVFVSDQQKKNQIRSTQIRSRQIKIKHSKNHAAYVCTMSSHWLVAHWLVGCLVLVFCNFFQELVEFCVLRKKNEGKNQNQNQNQYNHILTDVHDTRRWVGVTGGGGGDVRQTNFLCCVRITFYL